MFSSMGTSMFSSVGASMLNDIHVVEIRHCNEDKYSCSMK